MFCPVLITVGSEVEDNDINPLPGPSPLSLSFGKVLLRINSNELILLII